MIIIKEALSDERFAEKEQLARLEREFGARLDAMANTELHALASQDKALEFGLERMDRRSHLLRPLLLKLIARSPGG